MHLAIAIFLALIFCAGGLLNKCPSRRPTLTSPECSKDDDCHNGYSCCMFQDGQYCSSTNPEKCTLNSDEIWRGETIVMEDGCTECHCFGYDKLKCTSEACGWQASKRFKAMSMAKCPVLKPRFANNTCNDTDECYQGQHCCSYGSESVCVSKSEDVCTYGDRAFGVGDVVTLSDNCTFCECAGFENMLCVDDECFRDKEDTKEKTGFCPIKRFETEVMKCRQQKDCPSEQNCCNFEDGKFCVSDRNNVCYFNGGKLQKLQSVTMSDNCTVCECRGYNIIMCVDQCKKNADSK